MMRFTIISKTNRTITENRLRGNNVTSETDAFIIITCINLINFLVKTPRSFDTATSKE